MIVFPNEDNYVSSYLDFKNNATITLTVIDTKTNDVETEVSYHLCCPMTNQEVYNYCNARISSNVRNKILLGVRDYDNIEDNKLPKISIWKLDWLCRNITERKIVLLVPEGGKRIAINPYDEKEVEKFIETLKDLAK